MAGNEDRENVPIAERGATPMAGERSSTTGELEQEFQRLCGDDSSETLQVCDRLLRVIKDTQTCVMAEVSRHLRTGSPGREAIEAVGLGFREEALALLSELREEGKRFAVMERWTELVVASLDCDSRDDFVRKLADTIVTSKVVDQLLSAQGWQREEFSERVKETLEVNSSLQEAMRRQVAELCKLRELRQKYQEQSEELQMLRQQAKGSPGAAQECSRQSPGRKKDRPYRLDALSLLKPETCSTDAVACIQGGCEQSAREMASTRHAAKQTCLQPGHRIARTGQHSPCFSDERSPRLGPMGGVSMAQYLRHIALPEVVPYSG
ncbi:unnamed protein product [Heligmosomoides polygyrus]|uniref:Uncharacterized protein n=1 Tax=Heligmosomoides polygyrus TaxID=6339 RepID=A0A183G0T9_HELPZ|nr:unnamed protein product [Heligmosomoides polygyrus]